MKFFHKMFFMILAGTTVFCGVVGAETQLNKLMREKQQKMKVLEECSSKVKGFQIAGISTLGLTAVGIGGNVALASKQKGLEYQITKKQNELSTEQTTLNSLNSKIEKIESEKAKQDCAAKGGDFVWLNNACINKNEIKSEEDEPEKKFVKMEITRMDALKPGEIDLPEGSVLSEEEITKRMHQYLKSSEKDLKQQQKKNAECKRKKGENYWWNGEECIFARDWDISTEISRMEPISVSKMSLPVPEGFSDKEIKKNIHDYVKKSEKDLKQRQKEMRKQDREDDRLEKQIERQEMRIDNKLDREEDKNERREERAADKLEKELEKAERQCDKKGDDWYWNGKECIFVAKPSSQEVVRSYGASGTNYGIDGRSSISSFVIEAH